MTAPVVHRRDPVGSGARTAQAATARRPDRGAHLAAVGLGAVLVAMGSADLLLGFYPAFWGNPEWVFTTILGVFTGTPTMAIGMGAMVVGSVGADRRSLLVVALVLNALVFLILLGLAIPFAGAARVALGVADPGVHEGVVRALTRGVVYAAGFIAFHGWLALLAGRRLRSPAGR